MDLQMIECNARNKSDTCSHATRKTLTDEELTERYDPPAFSLDGRGFIQECGKSVEKLFGYRQHELVWQHISCLFPKLADVSLIQENRLNPMLYYICRCGHVFEAINKQSDTIVCNLNFFLIEHEGVSTLRLIVRPVAGAKS